MPTAAEPPLFATWRARVEAALGQALDGATAAPRLQAAMRHAVLGGGKRLRPLLAHAAAQACGGPEGCADAAGTAVELVHAFSLVHDDLPAMDDDAMRRGRPTVHVAFDEATAILAGDALQAEAFRVLADAPLDAGVRVALLGELARASGADGMCAGQMLDMEATGRTTGVDALARLHALKTGALIRAAVRLGALSAGAGADGAARLDPFAEALGLAFQVRDDLLDDEASSQALGKTAGKDRAQGKATYATLLGREGAMGKLGQLQATMREALAPFDARADALRALADFSVARGN
jgi:farnesyl diphosphate synthase